METSSLEQWAGVQADFHFQRHTMQADVNLHSDMGSQPRALVSYLAYTRIFISHIDVLRKLIHHRRVPHCVWNFSMLPITRTSVLLELNVHTVVSACTASNASIIVALPMLAAKCRTVQPWGYKEGSYPHQHRSLYHSMLLLQLEAKKANPVRNTRNDSHDPLDNKESGTKR